MMKLIADSSANLTMLEGVTYQSVPMTIRAGERDFVDDERSTRTSCSTISRPTTANPARLPQPRWLAQGVRGRG